MTQNNVHSPDTLQGKTLSILLADDHDLTREVLKDVIEQQSDWKIAGQAADGSEAVQLAGKISPDVLVIDVAMPGMTGIEAVRKIKENTPDIPVLMVSNYANKKIVEAALEAGASGYISKQHAFEDLVPAIKSIRSGKQYFCKKADKMMKS